MIYETEIIKEIIDLINHEKANIQSQCQIGLFDDNKYWEGIIKYLMNSAYGYSLVNLNVEKINYPGIDLGDRESGLGIQVTETRTSPKLVNSLDKVLNNEVYREFPRFKMFVLGDKQKSYTVDLEKYEGKIEFDKTKDILDFKDLIAEINKLNKEEMQDILDFLKMEFQKKDNNDVRKHIMFILSYLDNSLKWIELASGRGCFFTDFYRCDRYVERCEAISHLLSPDEFSKLYALLTDINQMIDYMEEANDYVKSKTSNKKRSGGYIGYKDAHTIGLSCSVRYKAEQIIEKWDITEILKELIHIK